MTQVISYMNKAFGVTPAANHSAGTLYPNEGSFPSLTAFTQGQVLCVRSEITVTSLALATNDILVALAIPPGHTPVDAMIIADDTDTGTGLALTLAQLNQDFTDIVSGTDLITASTVAQAGGVARASVAAGFRIAAVTPSATVTGAGSATTRWFGLKCAAGIGTAVNSGAVLTVELFYRAITGTDV
jgi:hypothetical protein